jgi:hypothetical protein
MTRNTDYALVLRPSKRYLDRDKNLLVSDSEDEIAVIFFRNRTV